MSVSVKLAEHSITIEVRGRADRFFCMSGDQHLPYEVVTSARHVEWTEVRSALRTRVAGGYVPGRLATGWYTQRGVKRVRQFLAVYRDRSNLLLIETTLRKPARVVVAVPDAPLMAAEITERLA